MFVDLPGVEKDDIEVLTKDKELTITATKNSPYQANSSKDNKDGKSSTVNSVKHIERFSGQMTRVMTLPDNINIEEISAEFTNGVLHLQLPKLISEKQTVKKLSIK